jgi:hypothetical protein
LASRSGGAFAVNKQKDRPKAVNLSRQKTATLISGLFLRSALHALLNERIESRGLAASSQVGIASLRSRVATLIIGSAAGLRGLSGREIDGGNNCDSDDDRNRYIFHRKSPPG